MDTRISGSTVARGILPAVCCGENMERSERSRSVVRKDPGREEKGVGSGSG